MITLTIGTRIYYTGNISNLGGYGEITALNSSEWGDFFTLTFDDGRVSSHLIQRSIEDATGKGEALHHGSRWYLADTYDAERMDHIERRRAALAR